MELKNTFSAITKNDGIKPGSPPKVFSVGYNRGPRKTHVLWGIKPGSPQNVCLVGYNSVRGFEENDKKRKETTAKPPHGAKTRERRDSSAGTRSTANILQFCDAKRSVGVPAESIFGGA